MTDKDNGNSPVTLESLARLPKVPLVPLYDGDLPLAGSRVYIYVQQVPDLTDTDEQDINKKRRIPHINPMTGKPWVLRFAERVEAINE